MLFGADVDDTNDDEMRVTSIIIGSKEPALDILGLVTVAFISLIISSTSGNPMLWASAKKSHIDHNVFKADDDDDAILTRVGGDPRNGKICTTHNRLLNGAEEADEDCDSVSRPDYNYRHDDDMDEVEDIVRNGAGAR